MKFKFPIQPLYNGYRNALRHPQYRWWIVGATLVYLMSPIDISPDVLPLLGQIDDAMLITLLVGELATVLRDRIKTIPASTESEP
jgi:uncharacterized membrane protein YkvA (DUF1232 family)